jgi:hypothetical protein
MKRTLVLCLLLSFTVTGCTGSFNLTRKLYNTHRSQPEKWTDEILFLAFIILPVYSITTLADGLVFNSIEFWTGENPIEMVDAGDGTLKLVQTDGTEAQLKLDEDGKLIVVTDVTPDDPDLVTLQRVDNGLRIIDQDGELVYRSVLTEQGDYLLYNAEGRLVKNYSQDELAQLSERITQ